ncbi:MAG: hypothetical protein NPIRA03_09910 [Nitrospirales bacterium]|nr:MAG: hypothetical protein NPIRA03_09910 [Nitrospirales bacterium]
MFTIRVLFVGIITLAMTVQVYALDAIPEKLSDWTEKGVVLQNSSGLAWENKPGIAVSGISKVGGIYYLHYLAGFNGCWNADGDVNHQSLGLATSTDGVNFTKYAGNPVLKPHDFLPVSSQEEGVRTAYIRYLPSKGKFYGYFGVESPGGSQTCNFGGGGTCGCNIGVDARVYGATSVDGKTWTVEGSVGGTYSSSGSEVYAADWVYDGSNFSLYVTTAEGGRNKAASRGSNPLSLNELGGVSALDWGWSGLDAYLHDDNNTLTLIYNPQGGSHPGSSNDNLYFATTHLDDMKNIQNERVITTSGVLQNKIFRDGNEWKWYYSDDPSWNNNVIKLRTHPITNADNVPPQPPKNLKVAPIN